MPLDRDALASGCESRPHPPPGFARNPDGHDVGRVLALPVAKDIPCTLSPPLLCALGIVVSGQLIPVRAFAQAPAQTTIITPHIIVSTPPGVQARVVNVQTVPQPAPQTVIQVTPRTLVQAAPAPSMAVPTSTEVSVYSGDTIKIQVDVRIHLDTPTRLTPPTGCADPRDHPSIGSSPTRAASAAKASNGPAHIDERGGWRDDVDRCPRRDRRQRLSRGARSSVSACYSAASCTHSSASAGTDVHGLSTRPRWRTQAGSHSAFPITSDAWS